MKEVLKKVMEMQQQIIGVTKDAEIYKIANSMIYNIWNNKNWTKTGE